MRTCASRRVQLGARSGSFVRGQSVSPDDSFGVVLEEIDENGLPLFRSALKESLDRAVELISGFADKDDETFNDVMAVTRGSIFTAIRSSYRVIYNSKATFRMLEERFDRTFDAVAVERAYDRAQLTTTREEEFAVEGELLGVIPIGRRFEFKRKDDGKGRRRPQQNRPSSSPNPDTALKAIGNVAPGVSQDEASGRLHLDDCSVLGYYQLDLEEIRGRMLNALEAVSAH